MDAHGWGYDTHIRRILRDLTDQTVDGLTVRCLDGDAYQLEGAKEPSPQKAVKPPKVRCQKCNAYTPHTLTETDDGWLRATCERCGNKTYTRPEEQKGGELL